MLKIMLNIIETFMNYIIIKEGVKRGNNDDYQYLVFFFFRFRWKIKRCLKQVIQECTCIIFDHFKFTAHLINNVFYCVRPQIIDLWYFLNSLWHTIATLSHHHEGSHFWFNYIKNITYFNNNNHILFSTKHYMHRQWWFNFTKCTI